MRPPEPENCSLKDFTGVPSLWDLPPARTPDDRGTFYQAGRGLRRLVANLHLKTWPHLFLQLPRKFREPARGLLKTLEMQGVASFLTGYAMARGTHSVLVAGDFNEDWHHLVQTPGVTQVQLEQRGGGGGTGK